MLLVTIDATCGVLVQRTESERLGTLPTLNVPGPKLWAVPLLQRPTGRTPELAGVVATRAALLSLLAVWLVTAPRGGGRDALGGDGWVRPATRWASVGLFGVAFGTLLAAQGFWPSELPPYRLLLVAGVELPAAVLLYAHLRSLAAAVPGRDRRGLFDVLRWLVPAVVAAGAALNAAEWLGRPVSEIFRHERNRFAISAAYGIAAATAGVLASAAVGSLALAYCAAAFPEAWRVASGVRRFTRSTWRALAGLDAPRLRALRVAAGLALLVGVAVVGNDRVLWYPARAGVGGNVPFFNFPGPKLFAAAAVPELGRSYYWDPVVSRTILVALNLAAFWLVTCELDRRRDVALRALVRWVPVLATGAALGFAHAYHALEQSPREFFANSLGGRYRSEFFAAVTVACELPATALLYLYLAKLAARAAPGTSLRRQFLAAAVAVPAVVLSSFAAFLLSRGHLSARASPAVLALGAAYGAAALASAAWAAALVLALAGALVRRRVVAAPRLPVITPLYLDVPGDLGAAGERTTAAAACSAPASE
jgi:hypothetical protein